MPPRDPWSNLDQLARKASREGGLPTGPWPDQRNA